MVHKGDAAHNEINSFQSKAAKYKREGDAHFGKRNMREALASYGKAIEMSLSGTEEKAALFSNRAACYLMQNMYRHAVAECSHALNEAPDFKPALLRRAREYEQMHQYDRAVSDLEAAAKADPNSDDVRKKLQATRAARDNRKASRSVSGLGGGGLRAPGKRGTQRLTPAQQQAAAAAASGQGQGQLPTLTMKATLVRGEAAETKNVVLPISVRYKDIVDQVRNLFPDDLKEQPFALKYKDEEGDLVTVTSRTDLRGALSAAMHHAEQRAAATGVQRPRDAGLPPVEVEVVPCAKAPSETPDQIIPDHVGSRDHPPNAEDEGAEDVIEIDEWLLTFAGLFRKHLGEDGAKEGPLDLRQIGLEKCCEALEVAVEVALIDKDPQLVTDVLQRTSNVVAAAETLAALHRSDENRAAEVLMGLDAPRGAEYLRLMVEQLNDADAASALVGAEEPGRVVATGQFLLPYGARSVLYKGKELLSLVSSTSPDAAKAIYAGLEYTEQVSILRRLVLGLGQRPGDTELDEGALSMVDASVFDGGEPDPVLAATLLSGLDAKRATEVLHRFRTKGVKKGSEKWQRRQDAVEEVRRVLSTLDAALASEVDSLLARKRR